MATIPTKYTTDFVADYGANVPSVSNRTATTIIDNSKIIVNNEGSVLSNQDLVISIQDAVLALKRQGNSLSPAGFIDVGF